MSMDKLTPDQQAFLDKCTEQFANRYTDSDVEFKKVYDTEIPPPPIMCPWYSRPRQNNYRNRGHSSRYDNREYNHHDNYRDRSRSYHGDRDGSEDRRDGYGGHRGRDRGGYQDRRSYY